MDVFFYSVIGNFPDKPSQHTTEESDWSDQRLTKKLLVLFQLIIKN